MLPSIEFGSMDSMLPTLLRCLGDQLKCLVADEISGLIFLRHLDCFAQHRKVLVSRCRQQIITTPFHFVSAISSAVRWCRD